MGMEGSIARWYEKSTRKDMAQFRTLAERLKAVLPTGGDILEIAPGPGFLAIEMAKGGSYRVTGLDVSKTFVELARKNAAEVGVKVDFREGNAAAIPFPENSFDLLVCRAAFKNFSEPEKALQEMYRVLRPGGTCLVIDLRRDTPMSEIKEYVHHMGLSFLSRWFTLFTFRFLLLRRAYMPRQLERMLSDIPFGKKEIRTANVGMEVWLQK